VGAGVKVNTVGRDEGAAKRDGTCVALDVVPLLVGAVVTFVTVVGDTLGEIVVEFTIAGDNVVTLLVLLVAVVVGDTLGEVVVVFTCKNRRRRRRRPLGDNVDGEMDGEDDGETEP